MLSETTGPAWKDNIRLEAKALGQEDLAEREISAYEAAAKATGVAIKREGEEPDHLGGSTWPRPSASTPP